MKKNTLLEVFVDTLEKMDSERLPGYYYFECYVDERSSYLHCLMAQSEIMIADEHRKEAGLTIEEQKICEEALMKMINYYRGKMSKSLKGLLGILNEHIDLSLLTIQGKNEYDSIEWEITETGKVMIRYRHKGGATYNESLENIFFIDPKALNLS